MDTMRSNGHAAALGARTESSSVRTVAEARSALAAAGISTSEWARANGFKPSTVAAILRGDRPARIGKSHKIAVALRIKAGIISSSPLDV